ncbi:hypothetical protein FRACYDRAFT_237381 [Fragilariopsis cylindrus CCMP1102]|uniref:Uncharacterized protein n=1 Tax=Fragilariopsis cylindrus CCMP1102 TaxID=635003 RepID=A0A1E7FLP1_9STRA|nr:hypothetical protein FRACYDRAFT_237381 [Fragilariopsis cylindrus CCMP1102]|eukprot:OEU19088.1 hypothetical protein FRACYDRAFT_237381 [Fragilariopsis cylindrus CCMP1102]
MAQVTTAALIVAATSQPLSPAHKQHPGSVYQEESRMTLIPGAILTVELGKVANSAWYIHDIPCGYITGGTAFEDGGVGIPPSQHLGAPTLIGLADAFARENYMLNHNTELEVDG